MAIEWEEAETQPGVSEVGFEGIGGSGTTYGVWYGPAYLNLDAPPVMRWIAYGWPEPDSDSLPLFESCQEAMALCEAWETVKIHAEMLARALFQGVRSGQGQK